MLACIQVTDFAHIEQANFELPATGFCVLTGETGVGKSLLVDAVALGLGGRLAKNVVRQGREYAEISLLFAVADKQLIVSWLAEHGFGKLDDDLLLRRTIDGNRRSRAYINGRAATVSQLAELGSMLVSICGQHEHLLLRDANYRRNQIDVEHLDQVAVVAKTYADWHQAQQNLATATADAAKIAARVAELQAILDEYHQLNLSLENWHEQNRILTLHGNAAQLAELSAQFSQSLEQANEALTAARTASAELADLNPAATNLAEQIASLEILAQEAAREGQQITQAADDLNPQALAHAENFVAECHRLARRNGVVDVDKLPEHQEQVQHELDSLVATDIEALQKQEAKTHKAYLRAAKKLSAQRKVVAERLSKLVQGSIRKLGLSAASFVVQLVACDPSATGLETIKFAFAARKDSELADLASVASGGELSRIALALFTHTARSEHALIFDEVDSGVGGKVAAHVGSLLADLGTDRLVLCVTHLPQVAAAASQHWQVASTATGTAKFTAVSGAARQEEIARMLAGKKVTQASRENARDILAAATA